MHMGFLFLISAPPELVALAKQGRLIHGIHNIERSVPLVTVLLLKILMSYIEIKVNVEYSKMNIVLTS